MALKATIFKANLQVTDMDRHHYQAYPLTLARHPSETDERMMLRVLAFALHADEALQFGKGISSDEPALWRHDPTGLIELSIEIGQPDEAALRRACGKSREVVVYACGGGRVVGPWWEKNRAGCARLGNLRVFEVAAETSTALAALAERTMDLQCLVTDGEIQMLAGETMVPVGVRPLEGPYAA